jgi:hypothetical protein
MHNRLQDSKVIAETKKWCNETTLLGMRIRLRQLEALVNALNVEETELRHQITKRSLEQAKKK